MSSPTVTAIGHPRRYSLPARLFHWTTFVFVILMVPAGLYMTNRAALTNFDATTGLIYSAHKLAGFVFFWIAAARVGYRVVNGAPPPDPSLTAAQRRASSIVHSALYVLIISVPLTGWLAVSAMPANNVFGWFDIPRLLGTDVDAAKRLFQIHGNLAVIMSVIVGVHIGAALYHLVRKDGVFHRMWPRGNA